MRYLSKNTVVIFTISEQVCENLVEEGRLRAQHVKCVHTFYIYVIPLYFLRKIICPNICTLMGRDSAVGIATRYWLDSLGIETRWGLDFSHWSRPALGLTQPPVQWVPGLSC